MVERQFPPVQEPSFQGMFANDRAHIPTGFSQYVQNFYLEDGVYVPRPGMVSLGVLSAGNAIQGLVEFQELDGARHLLAFCDADMYEYDENTDSWDSTDLSLEGVTMDPSADLSFANSRGRLVVTDGVNTPWMLEDDNGSWDFTVLTNAPIANRAVIYYDKVFFFDIPGQENEFEWSDEGDPANGYAAEDQVWEFAQTDAGRIIGMAALNDTLNIFKEDSSTHLLGSVDENFRTSAVREGISETEGTVGGGSVVIMDGDVYLLSQNGPRAVAGGQRMIPINEAEGTDKIADIWEDVSRANWSDSLGFIDKRRHMVGWLVPTDSSDLNFAIIFSVDNNSWSVFSWDSSFDFTAVAGYEDNSGDEFLAFGDANGEVYKYGDDSVHTDDGKTIEYIVRSRLYGRGSPMIQKRLSEVFLRMNLLTDIHGEMSPFVEGEVGSGMRFGLIDKTGKFTYRRAFNDVGYYVGWEVKIDGNGEAADIESAVSYLSPVSTHANWYS